MLYQIEIIKCERTLATTRSLLKKIKCKIELKILNSVKFSKERYKRTGNDLNVDNLFWGEIGTADIEEDLEKKYYKLT